jgi:hypothetical protein
MQHSCNHLLVLEPIVLYRRGVGDLRLPITGSKALAVRWGQSTKMVYACDRLGPICVCPKLALFGTTAESLAAGKFDV